MVIIEIHTKHKFNIELKGYPVEEKLLCPICSSDRSLKNQRKKVLSWNHSKNIGHCHHCLADFVMEKPVEYKSYENRNYKKPAWKNKTELSDKVVKWFEGRKISQFVLKQFKISEGLEWIPQKEKEVNTIQFNYFRDDELINIKYRDAEKNFKLFGGAELILYNLDGIKDKDEIIIVEGEMDVLAFAESGYFNCVSIPNGATNGSNNLQYIDNCIDYLENVEKIIIATDQDKPGINLRTELSSRLGIEKCWKVDLKDCKDANDYLIKYGKIALGDVVKNAEQFPIEGAFNVSDFENELDNLLEYGLRKGFTIEIPEIDNHISYEFGRVYTITGIPGHGKSEFLDFIIERLNLLHGLRTAYFSPENHPLQLHASKLIEKITGVRFNTKDLDMQTYESSKEYLKDNFYFIMPKDGYEVDEILSRARALIFRKGIKILVLDPYNKFEHQREKSQSETEYISKFMDKLSLFAQKNNIIIFLVAHPTKMKKGADGLHEVPTLYDINGSANFYNKTDFGMTIYRNKSTGWTTVYIQKVKFKHLGEEGSVMFEWNKYNGRYSYFDGHDIHNIQRDNSCHLDVAIKEPLSDLPFDMPDEFEHKEF